MGRIRGKIREEIRELLPATLYFFVAFNAIGYTRSLMLREYGIRVTTFVHASVGALVAAKVLLIVGFLPFMEPFRRTPIIYNVLWKTLVYWLVGVVVQLLEELVPLALKHGSLAPALDEVLWPHFWVVQIWLVMLLLTFCTFREVIREIGHEKANEIFLGIRRGDQR